LLVSYSFDSDCAQFFKDFVVGKVLADHEAFEWMSLKKRA